MSYYPAYTATQLPYVGAPVYPGARVVSPSRRSVSPRPSQYNIAYHQQLLRLLNDAKRRLQVLGGHPQVIGAVGDIDQALAIVNQELYRPMP